MYSNYIKQIKTKYPDTIVIVIAGEGVRNMRDVQEYLDVSADQVSIRC